MTAVNNASGGIAHELRSVGGEGEEEEEKGGPCLSELLPPAPTEGDGDGVDKEERVMLITFIV